MKRVVKTVKRTKLDTKLEAKKEKKASGSRSAKPKTQAAATEPGVKPGKIVMSSYPLSCNCKLCSLDFCDCSEEEQGTVASAAAPAACGE